MTPSKTVTVWLAIDDAGCGECLHALSVRLASLWPSNLSSKSEQDENNVLNQTVDNAEQFGQPVDDELKAGEISMQATSFCCTARKPITPTVAAAALPCAIAPPTGVHGSRNQKGVIVSG